LRKSKNEQLNWYQYVKKLSCEQRLIYLKSTSKYGIYKGDMLEA